MQVNDSALSQQILAGLDNLSDAQRQRVLDFVRSIGNGAPQGERGADLIRRLPDIPATDLEEMARAIEEGCEKVDLDGW